MAWHVKDASKKVDLVYFGEPKAWSLDELEQIPHLQARTQQIRRILQTIKNIRDIDTQNKEFYANLTALSNLDFLSYLKITNQYYLLSTVFKDPKLNKRWLKILEDWRKHGRNSVQLEHSLRIKDYTKDTYKVTYSVSNELFACAAPDPSWSNLTKLFHYERERQRITVLYHNARADVLIKANDKYVIKIEGMIRVMENGNLEHREQAKLLRKKLEGLVKQKNELVGDEPKQLDVVAAQKRDVGLAQLSEELIAVANEVISKGGFSEDKIQSIKDITDSAKEENALLQEQYIKQMNSLNAEENKIINDTKVVIGNLFDSIIDKLSGVDLEKEGSPKNVLIGCIEQIKILRSSIDNARNARALQELLLKCREVINKIPEPEKTLLKSEITLIEAELNDPIESTLEQINISAIPRGMPFPSAPPFEHNLGANNYSESSDLEGFTNTSNETQQTNENSTMYAKLKMRDIKEQGNGLNGLAIPLVNMPLPSAPPHEGSPGDNETVPVNSLPLVNMPLPSAPPLEENPEDNSSDSVNALKKPNNTSKADESAQVNSTIHLKSKLKGMMRGTDFDLEEALQDLRGSMGKEKALSSAAQDNVLEIEDKIMAINPLTYNQEEGEKLEEVIGLVRELMRSCGQLSHLKEQLMPLQNFLDNYPNNPGPVP